MKIIEEIRSNIAEIKSTVRENPDLALITLMSAAAIAIGLVGKAYERKREDLAYEQRDNPAMILDMCGQELEKCSVEPITICTDMVIVGRDMSYCAESETLPLYTPLGK